MILRIYTDGACRGNPGLASYGFTIQDKKDKFLHKEGKFIGEATNNVAEYTAVFEALKYTKNKYGDRKLQVELFTDSKLVAQQLSGNFKIKSAHLKPIIEKIKIFSFELGGVIFTHIPRAKNTAADKLANIALDFR